MAGLGRLVRTFCCTAGVLTETTGPQPRRATGRAPNWNVAVRRQCVWQAALDLASWIQEARARRRENETMAFVQKKRLENDVPARAFGSHLRSSVLVLQRCSVCSGRSKVLCAHATSCDCESDRRSLAHRLRPCRPYPFDG